MVFFVRKVLGATILGFVFKMLFKDLAWNSSPFCSSIWGEYRAPSQVARRIYEVSTGMDWKVSAWGITTVYPIPTATTTQ